MTKFRRLVSVVIQTALVLVSIYKTSSLLQLKESDIRYSDYFAKETNIDVLFLGSSHVRCGFFAMELWNDYGISAYNLAADGTTIPVCYWTLVNALDYHEPEVIVVDVFDMWPGAICSPNLGQVHNAFDAFPLSTNKYKMTKDLFDDEKRWELLFGFVEYHTRWNAIDSDDFMKRTEIIERSAVWKGAEVYDSVENRSEKIYPDSMEGVEYDSLSEDYLRRIINFCQDKEISLILINTGYDCDDESKLFADSVYDIAAEYEVSYLDFTQDEIIDFATDLSSSGHNTHVNFSGAEKFTKYIGAYLSDYYQLADHRTEAAYSSWWDDYRAFVDSKADYLVIQPDLTNYLLFLADDNYQTIIEIKDPSILGEDKNMDMFGNIGIDYGYIDDDCNLIVVDNESRNVSYIHNRYNSGKHINSCIGELSFLVNEDAGMYEMHLGANEIYTSDIAEDTCRLRIAVINKNTGKVVDVRTF